MIAQILAIMAPVLLIAGAGFGWARLRRAYDTGLITDLVFYLGAPSLVFSALTGVEFDATLGNLALAAAISLTAFAVLGAPALWALRLPVRTYLPTVVFPNLGNMGLPLCLFAFGEPGLVLAVAFFAVGAIAHYTFGIWSLSGEPSPVAVLKTPMAYAGAAAILFQVVGIAPPEWLANAAAILGGMTIPLLLLTLGVSLGRTQIRNWRRAGQLAMLRLGIGFAVGLAVSSGFGFTGVERGVVILDCAMPTAVFNYLLAARFGTAPEDVAGAVAISTAVSVLTLPLLLLLVL